VGSGAMIGHAPGVPAIFARGRSLVGRHTNWRETIAKENGCIRIIETWLQIGSNI